MGIINTKTLDEWKNSMNTNGYSYFDEKEFSKKSSLPCYIAENAEGLDDIESYQSMYEKAISYITNELAGCSDCGDTHRYADTLLNAFFDNISEAWEFFSTFLEDYHNF